MSLKLTTSLSQRLVLTPQLRQRIEMLQMTTLELTDLIQQQILENPVLEEVATQEEVGELAEKILDHLASADPGAARRVGRLRRARLSSAARLRMARVNWKMHPRFTLRAMETEVSAAKVRMLRRRTLPLRIRVKIQSATTWSVRTRRATPLRKLILAASFRITSTLATRRRRSNTKKTRRLSNSF